MNYFLHKRIKPNNLANLFNLKRLKGKNKMENFL